MFDLSFYRDKKVLVTGHTGFKGSWMCQVLVDAGAKVTGYALNPPTNPSLFDIIKLQDRMNSVVGDVRDLGHMMQVFADVQPEIVIHLAAQPIVRESYKDPVGTYATNVMGTVNMLECVRQTKSVRSVVNVTTDKVYKNQEWAWGYRENEELNGYDPYSNSKSCSELVTSSYINSFFGNDAQTDREVAISTARAGNVIGGGDFASDRIIPDCVRAAKAETDIIVRNPYSTRPYQHVLEPVMAYLMLAQMQYEDMKYAGNYNIGPDDCDCVNTGDIVTLFCEKWSQTTGKNIKWINQHDGGPHEANFLKLDCSKAKSVLNWQPVWHIDTAVANVVEWTDAYFNEQDIVKCMQEQIAQYKAETK